ncbi:hypothetical protein [Kosakonia sacchari]|uniref:hypothetical protein n=1 Tax=Kosakonia sacchari TaxID=1158459 RepID=UPI000BE53F6D|nr:hypothetical protein [Kosakonia sacchari]PDO89709.1 hypothetical protein BK797_01630 [Kosakonia sacchari]
MTGSIIRFTPARVKCVALAALVSLSHCAASAAEAPASISGPWRIIANSTDTQATISFYTKVNDPSYVGRVVRFDNHAVSGDAALNIDCQQATLAGMKAAQRDWLKKRNQCQSDAACLTKSMQERTFELVSKIQ